MDFTGHNAGFIVVYKNDVRAHTYHTPNVGTQLVSVGINELRKILYKIRTFRELSAQPFVTLCIDDYCSHSNIGRPTEYNNILLSYT